MSRGIDDPNPTRAIEGTVTQPRPESIFDVVIRKRRIVASNLLALQGQTLEVQLVNLGQGLFHPTILRLGCGYKRVVATTGATEREPAEATNEYVSEPRGAIGS